jgi:D-xylonolactonase
MKPEIVVDSTLELGENPLWHPDEKRVYWVDIPGGGLYRYDPESGRYEELLRGDMIGGFTIQQDGALLLFMERGMIKKWREGRLETVCEGIDDERDSRFNDVIADPEGRVFCGTMPGGDHAARLYRLDLDGSIHRLLDGIGVSNGMGFTRDLKKLYFTDSRKGYIYRFDYDRKNGEIGNRQVFVDLSDQREGSPDGMTVDAEGFVWSARWKGGCLVRYSPEGEEVLRIPFPAHRVSSVTFGGEAYTDLYVTTAGGDNRAEEGAGAGALFRLRSPVGGAPEFRSRILL